MATIKKTNASAATKKPVKKVLAKKPVAKAAPAKKVIAKKPVAKAAPAKKVVKKAAPAPAKKPAKKAAPKLWLVKLVSNVNYDIEGEVTKTSAGLRIVQENGVERFVPMSQVSMYTGGSAIFTVPEVVRSYPDVTSFKEVDGSVVITFEDGETANVVKGGTVTINATQGEAVEPEEEEEEEEAEDEDGEEEEAEDEDGEEEEAEDEDGEEEAEDEDGEEEAEDEDGEEEEEAEDEDEAGW